MAATFPDELDALRAWASTMQSALAELQTENQLLRQKLEFFIKRYFGGKKNESLDPKHTAQPRRVAARALNPACKIFGVEPEAGNDGQQSFRKGEIVHIDTPKTLADGAQTQHLGNHTFAVIRELVDDIVTVSDAELVSAMQFFASRMKAVVEPTGCLAAAAALNA